MDLPETRYADVGNAQVAYQVIGDGPIDSVYHHGLVSVEADFRVIPASFKPRESAPL
jgi:hypothetical protein